MLINALPDTCLGHRTQFCFSLIACVVVSLSASRATSQVTIEQVDHAIVSGIEFLLSDQARNVDGTWGATGQELHTTAEVVRVLRHAQILGFSPDNQVGLPSIGSAIGVAYDAYSGLQPEDLERQSLVATLRLASGRSLGELRARILNQQQADGGWGLTAEYRSSVRDTVVVSESLLDIQPIGMDDDRLIAAIEFMDTQRRVEPSGTSWSHGNGGESTLVTTARGLIAVRNFGRSLGSDSAVFDLVNESLQYLVGQVDPNGTQWVDVSIATEWAALDTATYATVLRAYAGVRQPEELVWMTNGIVIRQGESPGADWDGAWSTNGELPSDTNPADVYSTAMALRALMALLSGDDEEQESDVLFDDFVLNGVATPSNAPPYLDLSSFQFDYSGPLLSESDFDDGVVEIAAQFFLGDPRVVNYDPAEGFQAATPIGTPIVFNPMDETVNLNTLYEAAPILWDDISLDGSTLIGVMLDSENEIAESNEYNNYAVDTIDSLGWAGGSVSGTDIAVLAGSLRVSSTNLIEDPVVRLSATIWNRGDQALDNATQNLRVHFRAGSVTDGFTLESIRDLQDGGGVFDPSFIDDPLYIGSVDVAFSQQSTLGSQESIEVGVDWIPVLSPSRTVTVIVEPLLDSWDQPETNNTEQSTFDFQSGVMSMSHSRAGNGDLYFDLSYGDNCFNPSFGFAAYYRKLAGDPWIPIEPSSYGAAGSIVPCSFVITRARTFSLESGSYQALGEVWYQNLTTGEQDFIDDEIIPFVIAEYTSVNAISSGFFTLGQGGEEIPLDPYAQYTGIPISFLGNLKTTLYFQSNRPADSPFSPTVEYRFVSIDDDVDTEIYAGTYGAPSEITESSLVYTQDLSSLTDTLLQGISYAVVVDVKLGDELLLRRYHVFAVGTTGGVVLDPKLITYPTEGSGTTGPYGVEVQAIDGEKIKVTVPIKNVSE